VSGAAVPTDLSYSEVGSIGLLATVTGYLGTSGVDLAGVYRNAGTGIVVTSGRGALRLSKPNLRGSVDLTANLGSTASGTTCSAGVAATATAASRPWLQGKWGASTWDRDPVGRAVFGVPRASAGVIYQRENY
jgi:hypothetical protein